jgi:hypothetical protein
MKDTKGREWIFRFTGRTVRELAAETKLDTKALTGPNSLLIRIGQDEETLYRVLWITIRPQARELGVNEDEWFESLDNDSIQAAAREWVEAYINFSHPARRAVLKKTLEATVKRMDQANTEIESLLASGELDAKIEEEIDRALTKSNLSNPYTSIAASSPESSE